MPKPPTKLDREAEKAKASLKDIVRSLARRAARRHHEEEVKAAAGGEESDSTGAREMDPAILELANLIGEQLAREAIKAAELQKPEPKRRDSRPLYSLDEAAKMLAISKKTLTREIARGNMPYVLIGKRRKIASEDLDRYIDQQRRRVELPEIARPSASGRRSPVYDFEARLEKRKAERAKRRGK